MKRAEQKCFIKRTRRRTDLTPARTSLRRWHAAPLFLDPPPRCRSEGGCHGGWVYRVLPQFPSLRFGVRPLLAFHLSWSQVKRKENWDGGIWRQNWLYLQLRGHHTRPNWGGFLCKQTNQLQMFRTGKVRGSIRMSYFSWITDHSIPWFSSSMRGRLA